jgi:hypothetical protein
LVKYWDKRIAIFGPEKAFLSMKLTEALKDDEAALCMGFMRLMPARDASGRSILFIDPSRLDKSKYSRESMVRATWYVIHAALENVQAQKKGIVFLAYPKNAKFGEFDRTLTKMKMESIRGCLPVRVSAFHICHPPVFFSIIWPFVSFFLGERLRKRVRVESGSNEKIMEKLANCGLTKDCVPSELGGNIVLDHKNWLLDRKASGL